MTVLASGFDTLEATCVRPAWQSLFRRLGASFDPAPVTRRARSASSTTPAAYRPDSRFIRTAHSGSRTKATIFTVCCASRPMPRPPSSSTNTRAQPLNGANDLVFDKDGNIYFSDPWRSNAENPIGGFYRYTVDGELQQIDTGLAFPNGVALTHDGQYVILAETYRNRIAALSHRYRRHDRTTRSLGGNHAAVRWRRHGIC